MHWDGPILDNHLHADTRHGTGLAAVDAFVAAGGTHLLIVNKPSWWYGIEVEDPSEFLTAFEATIDMASRASDRLPGRAWPVLGVHPALISRLVDDRGMTPAAAGELMRAGIDRAASIVADGRALALKSGRPHYPVSDEVWEASNRVIRHAFDRAGDVRCAVQLHAESGDAFSDIGEWASEAGLGAERVVKHFAEGPIEGAVPSVISRPDALAAAIDADGPFLMETDYLDDPDRPGAVLGPRTVPRRVRWLVERGDEAAVERAHVDTPRTIYGIDLEGDRSE